MQRAVPYFADSRASYGGKLPANEFLLKNILWTCLSLLVSKKCAYERHTGDENLPQRVPNYSVKGLSCGDGLTPTFGGWRIQ